MNTESESELAKITRSSVHGQVQGTTSGIDIHIGLRNSQVVAQEYEPPLPAAADAAFETGVIR